VTDRLRREVRYLKELGVLQNIVDHRLEYERGAILVTCADGDRFPDVFTHQARLQERNGHPLRLHTLSWNGGALILAPRSPAVKRGRTTDLDAIDQIRTAREMKGINTVALHIHTPCGVAHALNLDLASSLELHMAAKLRLRSVIDGVCVTCFLHVDFGEGKMKTYYVSREQWERSRSLRSL